MEQMKKVPIALDKVRSLYFDVNALIDLGEVLDINLLTAEGWREFAGAEVELDGKTAFVPAMPSFAKVRAIVWAGLRHEDQNLTLRQVGAMLTMANLRTVTEAYSEAFQTADGGAPPQETASPLAVSAHAESAS